MGGRAVTAAHRGADTAVARGVVLRAQGGGAQQDLLRGAELVNGVKLVAKPVSVPTMKDLQALGDVAREGLGSGAAALLGTFEDGKLGLVIVITDDLRAKGLNAGAIVKALGAKAGIKGGGKEHMAQAGVPEGQGAAVLELAAAELRTSISSR